MKLLLTSGGVSNPTLRAELVRLIGKPIEHATALVVVTAQYGHPMCSPFSVHRAVTDAPRMGGLGWKRVGLLDLGVLESLDPARWRAWLEEVDALVVDGGDARFLAYWLRRSGLFEVASARADLVWVGMSAGSMALTPVIGDDFTHWRAHDVFDGAVTSGGGEAAGDVSDDDEPLGLVDFAIFPHLDHPDMPENVLPVAHAWADEIGCRAYALDDESAIAVETGPDGRRSARVVSEGVWHRLR